MTILQYIKENINGSFVQKEMPFETKTERYKKSHVFCDYGELEENIFFLQKGIIQVEVENSQHDTRIVDFFIDHGFFCAYTSLLTSSPSDVRIIATTDCKVERFEAQALFEAYKTSLVANQLGRYASERLYLRRMKREKDFLTKTAEERYIDLISQNSEITSELNVDQIAKYLGIRPESLSRIRGKSIKQIG